ncbi:sugar ABC transporter substrate-binding protein [Rhodococcus sp. IC4_135]|uniref:substrate-binding domain-containing protein n=1 Tax=Rhodococcus sp. IC4_135 TaxID=2715537 RepID=UPI00141F9F53|nr:sugar ABC transporter substrate-binding protein [Rhodococcus sp. IC4_135]
MASLMFLSACGSLDSSEGSADGKPNVAVFLSASANAFEQAQLAGVEAAAKDFDGGQVTAFDGAFDSTKQVAQIQDAVTSGGFDVFVIEPVDAVAVVPALKSAAAKNIKVVCMFVACGPDPSSLDKQFDGQAGVVAMNFEQVATVLATSAIDACADKRPCKVAYLNGDVTFTSDRLALDSVNSAFKTPEADGITLVASQDGKYDAATSRKAVQDMFQRDPDIDVLVSYSDQQTQGAVQALQAIGRFGNVKIISNGATEAAVEAVRNGTYFSEGASVPRSWGYKAGEIGIKLAQGNDVSETSINTSDLSPVGGLINQQNVSNFTAEYK